MWVASFLRLILASRYQVGVWPIEVFPHSQTHDLAKDLAISQDLRKVAKVPKIWGSEGSNSGVSRGQNLVRILSELRDFRGLRPPKNRSFSGGSKK